MVHVLLKSGLENSEHYFSSMWDECKCVVVWAFFGTEMKTGLFQTCGHCWVFQICWNIECSTFTASSFRIWNSSTGIPSPPLALLVVILPKAHLTSHSRMSGSRWVITPSWLSGLWRSFWHNSSVYSCQLFLISSAPVRSIPFFYWLYYLHYIFQSSDSFINAWRFVTLFFFSPASIIPQLQLSVTTTCLFSVFMTVSVFLYMFICFVF